jgi:pyruvate/2-oxoglutarate dehydrogenase complex dihydrolipoamide dehydrogenase (E3) component
MKNVYDLAVIGAGPAGIVGATTAASLGARVVLIDRFGDLGGRSIAVVEAKNIWAHGVDR